MPNNTVKGALVADSAAILNAIRNGASVNYKEYVPAVIASTDVRKVGAIIMQNPELQNEFLHSLVNRIGAVMMTTKMYENPWAFAKQGVLEFGETMEEIFVNLAEPFKYDPAVAESEIFKRETPDVRSAFHILNFQDFYKVTVTQQQLKLAFLSNDGVQDLVTAIVNSMYSAANYDEFLVMKYMVARSILDGTMTGVVVDQVSKENSDNIVIKIKNTSNQMTFMCPDYNPAGVRNFSPKEDQYLISSADFDATMNVATLAQAFNMDKAEFDGHHVMVDSFGKLDNERLKKLFGTDSWYAEIGASDLAKLAQVPAVLVDKAWFMVWDNLAEYSDQYNGQGLYWNYWYHVWKTFSVSPFANCAVFVTAAQAVKSVTVTPATATLPKGASLDLTASVVTDNFANQAVKWTVTGEGNKVTSDGRVTLASNATGTVTVTATSVADPSKTGKCTITVG